ncbi:MAG: TylF/MycF family methyltransferase, partial [Helicobacter sp.]|nr:TylF/MycF family methyltransferase [Helicobacter sp.]
GHEILCFLDNDPAKQGKTIALESAGGGGQLLAYNVDSPQILPKSEFDKILISTYIGHREVLQQLEKDFGIPSHKIDSNFVIARIQARHTFLENFAAIAKKYHLEGNCAECGVYRGEFARLINLHFPTKKLYLMDTFESFAPQDLENESAEIQKHAKIFANTSVELVLSKMPHVEQCIVKKGWFPETAKGLENERFCFVSLDTDLYDPILAGLEFFYPRMVSGGVILVDDYFDKLTTGVAKAVESFCAKNHISFAPIGDGFSVVVASPT